MKILRKMVIFAIVLLLLGSVPQVISKFESSNHNRLTTIDDSFSITGEAAILLDDESGDVLFSKNERKRLFPASTTKILTALIAIENGNMNDQIVVGKENHLKIPGESTAWLKEGQVLNLKELLAGMMLPSGNDAARTIAIYVVKKQTKNAHLSEEEALELFVAMMNKKAKKLGTKDSHFTNPHGLHHQNHYSTANDIAIIAKAAMKYPQFKEIVRNQKYTDEFITFENRNKLVDPNSSFFFEGANGIKTGFTPEAGYCLVSSADRNGQKLIAVVLKSSESEIWHDSISLLEGGFHSNYVKK